MSAFYAGLDVSDRTTAICVIDAQGRSVLEESVDTNPIAIARALKPYGRMLQVVGQESGSKGPWLHKELSKRRLPVVCLDARLASANLSAQRNKTDKNDARGIANIIRTGWYSTAYVKSDEAHKLRLLLTHRRALKRKAIGLELTLRMSVKVFGAGIEKKAGIITMKWGMRHPDPLLVRLAQTMIRARAALLAEVKTLDKLVTKLAKADRVCRRLMTVPGVGPQTALTFRAGVDDPHRFASSRTVGAYFGLTPRRHQSGLKDVSGRISRIGDESVRTSLYEAAVIMMTVSKSDCALRAWALQQREEKGLRRAAVALARKLAVVMHRMWVTERDFDARPAS